MNPLCQSAILYRDEHLVAINKPSGMVVHRSARIRHAPAALQCLRDLIGQHVYPVHRLDRGTSGVLLFALSSEAARELCLLFRNHQDIAKTYLAVVRGYTDEAGVIDHPVPNGTTGERKDAVSHYRRLQTVEFPIPCGPYETARYSLVEVTPETGRYHQIRRHFHHISHPVVGDTTHGDTTHNELFRNHFQLWRLLLMAVKLSFKHPFTGASLTIQTPVDDALMHVFHDPAAMHMGEVGQ